LTGRGFFSAGSQDGVRQKGLSLFPGFKAFVNSPGKSFHLGFGLRPGSKNAGGATGGDSIIFHAAHYSGFVSPCKVPAGMKKIIAMGWQCRCFYGIAEIIKTIPGTDAGRHSKEQGNDPLRRHSVAAALYADIER
jgi:hypothetical protein